MNTWIRLVLVLLVTASPAAAQRIDTASLWRAFAEKLEVGTVVKVRLYDGQTFRGTFLEAQSDALLVQPRTRLPVPIRPVPYDAIASLERQHTGGGVGAGKAALIGVATGVGAFLATLLVFVAAAMD